MKTYKFNPISMNFQPDNERRNIICLLIAALIILLLVLCYKTDEGKEMYIEGGKVSQNAQEYEMDSTIVRYRNSVAFRAIVKAAEIRYNSYLKDSTVRVNFK
mgnify:CR=1 FL=1